MNSDNGRENIFDNGVLNQWSFWEKVNVKNLAGSYYKVGTDRLV